jgi:hypothetical protein
VQTEKSAQPFLLSSSMLSYIFPTFGTTDDCTQRNYENIDEQMFFAPIISRISHPRKMRQHNRIGDLDRWAGFLLCYVTSLSLGFVMRLPCFFVYFPLISQPFTTKLSNYALN